MSKTPPVPAENQSPYPTVEPPHAPAADNETVKIVKEMAAAKARRSPSAREIGIGAAAVGVGSAAVVAALLFWRGNRKDGK
jgi:hypothetical protein